MRAKPSASQRTKNRIRENPNLEAVSFPREVLDLGLSILYYDKETDWLGWLPVQEVETDADD